MTEPLDATGLEPEDAWAEVPIVDSLWDADGDGTAAWDTTGDGHIDFYEEDNRGDGLVDRAEVDLDHDGTFDNAVADTTGDGRLDRVIVLQPEPEPEPAPRPAATVDPPAVAPVTAPTVEVEPNPVPTSQPVGNVTAEAARGGAASEPAPILTAPLPAPTAIAFPPTGTGLDPNLVRENIPNDPSLRTPAERRVVEMTNAQAVGNLQSGFRAAQDSRIGLQSAERLSGVDINFDGRIGGPSFR